MPRSTVVATEEAEKRKQNRLPEIESMVPFCDLRKLHTILSLWRLFPLNSQQQLVSGWVGVGGYVNVHWRFCCNMAICPSIWIASLVFILVQGDEEESY